MNSKVYLAAVLLVAGSGSAPSHARAQTIDYPLRSTVDRPTPVRVRGLTPGSIVALRTQALDAAGQLWMARALFRVDGAGAVDTGRDSPLSGSYEGIQPAGLFNQMHAVGDGSGLRRFQASGSATFLMTLVLEDTTGVALDSVVVERGSVGSGVTVAQLAGREFRGHLFVPSQPSGPGVVVLGGSDGGFADDVAALLATNGFRALSVAYFGVDGLPPELVEISLDGLMEAVDSLRAQAGVWSDRVAIFGTSKGAEAALLAASHQPAVSAVVAYAPSAVAWSCICSDPARSSWSLRGTPVAAVAPGADPAYQRAPGEPLRPTVNYLYRLRSAPETASIPVERIHGPLLLIAGGEDQLWPSLAMAQLIMERRRSLGGHRNDQLLSYPYAGHLIGKAYLPSGSTRLANGRLETGGSPSHNARAQADAWPRVVAFLARALAR